MGGDEGEHPGRLEAQAADDAHDRLPGVDAAAHAVRAPDPVEQRQDVVTGDADAQVADLRSPCATPLTASHDTGSPRSKRSTSSAGSSGASAMERVVGHAVSGRYSHEP